MQPGCALVTGGAGFLGAHVARALLGLGWRVVVLDDLSGGFVENVPAGAELVVGDIGDAGLVGRLFAARRFRRVYHLAAFAAENLSHFARRLTYASNLMGSVNLINHAVNHEVDCFVFTSSIAVYGAGTPPLSEESIPRPEDPYGIAKLAVEQELAACRRMFGLPSVIFRPHNVYGPGQNLADPYRNVIGIFLARLLQGRPMPIFGTGEQTRAFSYIDDVAPFVARGPDAPGAVGETFNIGSDERHSIRELAGRVAEALGMAPHYEHHEARREAVHAFADHAKFRRVFSPPPPVPLREGLQRMAAWARTLGPRPAPRSIAVEIARNLPAAWRS